MYTKLQTVKKKVVLFCLVSVLSMNTVFAQVWEAALTGAIAAGSVSISGQMSQTNALQAAVLGENTVISSLLNDIYGYEKQMYDYMSKAQGIVTSAYSIGKCLKMGSDKITEQNNCRKEAESHPEGLLVSSLVTGQYSDLIAESSALISYLTPIVKGSGKNNLLNSAERIRILSSVENRLYNILFSIKRMKYNIQRLRVIHIARELSPDFYYNFYNTRDAYETALIGLKRAQTKL